MAEDVSCIFPISGLLPCLWHLVKKFALTTSYSSYVLKECVFLYLPPSAPVTPSASCRQKHRRTSKHNGLGEEHNDGTKRSLRMIGPRLSGDGYAQQQRPAHLIKCELLGACTSPGVWLKVNVLHRVVCCKQCVICLGGRTRSRHYRFPEYDAPLIPFLFWSENGTNGMGDLVSNYWQYPNWIPFRQQWGAIISNTSLLSFPNSAPSIFFKWSWCTAIVL